MIAAAPVDLSRGAVRLLAGQAFTLGLAMALTLIPASAIFLAAYGSDLLPVTYIGAAVAGAASTAALASAFRRRPLAAVATMTLAGTTVALLASWVLLSTWQLDWVSFALLTIVPIMVPVGFIFVVGQAGMLLDVRALKASYARVVAGFALGCVVGGLSGAPLLTVLGSTESLLIVAAAAAVAFLALVEVTRRRHPGELTIVETTGADVERPTLRTLVGNRYVMLIVAFQMLSAVESQWLDYHVFATAASRYESNEALARFVSEFSAIAYGTDIVFLLVVAGFLLHRFGLRYGLAANSVAVLTLVAAVIVATAVTGAGATIVFVLIVAARVTDLTFSDGASRTSLSAAYQAVPTRMRAVSQAMVEGLAVPVAIGLSGVVLLGVQALEGTEGLMLPMLTAIVVIAWVVVAVLLYRSYRVSLLANMRSRTLDPAELLLEEEGLIVVDRLVESDDERDVRLGLDILTVARHPELPDRLQLLVVDERVSIRTDALERLVELAPQSAAAAAREHLDDGSAEVRAAALRVLGAARRPDDLAAVATLWIDPERSVRVAAAFAMTRVGDDDTRREVVTEITRLSRSSTADDRVLAARIAGEIEPAGEPDRLVLARLLADEESTVVNAALAALRGPDDRELLPEVSARLDERPTAAAAIGALVRAGDDGLGVIDDGLGSDGRTETAQEMLVRAARDVGSPAAISVLRNHVGHHNREVGLAVMRALAALGPTHPDPRVLVAGAGDDADGGDADHALTATVVHDDLEHATRIVHALDVLHDEPAGDVLRTALRDELALIRRRVLAAFAMRHGTDGFNRVVFQLTQSDSRTHALALEWLDVTLTDTDRAAVAILEPRLSDRERLNRLSRWFPVERLGRQEILVDLVRDGSDAWRRPWLAACALYVAAAIPGGDVDTLASVAPSGPATTGLDGTSVVDETLRDLRDRHLRPV